MAIGGWKTRSVFDRYNIVSTRDLHDAAAKLERYLDELAVEGGRKKSKTQSKTQWEIN